MPLIIADWAATERALRADSIETISAFHRAIRRDPEYARRVYQQVDTRALNPAAMRYFGMDEHSDIPALALSVRKSLPIEAVIDMVAAFLGDSSENRWRMPMLTPGGEHRLSLSYWVIPPAFGTSSVAVTALVDRTEDERHLAALRASEERYRRVVQDQTEFVVRYSAGGVRTFVNDAYCRHFGPRERLLGTSFLVSVAEEFRDAVERKIASLVPGGEPVVETHRVILEDGSEAWQEWVDCAVAGADGNVEYQAVGRDVTRRVEAERALRKALQEVQALRDQLAAENTYLREEVRNHHVSSLVGVSDHLRELRALIARVGGTDATVLVLGETGTGKELVAQAVHDASPRASRAIVKVNCAAISETLVEAELFGHVRGAFTGAERDRPGRFRAADGGTLFLDEIGELSPQVQAKLLRVLQEGTYEPVGTTETAHVDVRLVAATNRDLQAEVDAGRFRADLFYRLHVVPIHIEPLRARPEDIPVLAEMFLRHYSAQHGRGVLRFSDEALNTLIGHDWPGNVRELSNAIERAVIVAGGSVVGSDDLRLPRAVAFEPRVARRESVRGTGQTPGDPLPSLEDVERDHIEAVLRQTQGVIGGRGGAAEILGLPASTLRSRMKRLGIGRAD